MKFFTPHCPDILNTVPLSKGLLADLEIVIILSIILSNTE